MIFIGSDHAGFVLKDYVYKFLRGELNLEVEDLGCFSENSVDYPDVADKVCTKVKATPDSFGILICGTGIGMSIYANKVQGIRCALCTTEYSAEMAKKHNNANVLALGGKVIGNGIARNILKFFLHSAYEGGKHDIRLEKITKIEN